MKYFWMICWLNKGHNNEVFISYEKIRGGLLSLIYWHSRSSHTRERDERARGTSNCQNTWQLLFRSHHLKSWFYSSSTTYITLTVWQWISAKTFQLLCLLKCLASLISMNICAAATLLHTFISVRPWSSNHMIDM